MKETEGLLEDGGVGQSEIKNDQLQSAINSLKIELEIERKQVEIDAVKKDLRDSEHARQLAL